MAAAPHAPATAPVGEPTGRREPGLPWEVAAAWAFLLAAFAGAVAGTGDVTPPLRMVVLIAVVFAGMKLVVLASAGGCRLPLGRLIAFAVLWPGMNPALVRRRGPVDVAAARGLAVRGILFVIAGAAFFLAARAAYQAPAIGDTAWAALPLVAAMVAFSLAVHFGLFGLVAAGWRAAGFPAHELFRAPWRARSLEDFWGRRWNLAYVEMITLAVYRPLRRRVGLGRAEGLAFLVSGLLHEAAISFPVGTGYGLPTLYFLLQAVALRVERHPRVRRALRGPAVRRTWTFGWVLLPTPILFFPAFVRGVVAPLLSG